MKHFICILVAALLLCSCEKSNEDKAKDVIKQHLKESLNDWNSYEPVKFSSLDSTFTRSTEDTFIKGAIEQFEYWQKKADSYQKNMKVFNALSSSFGKEQYAIASSDYNNAVDSMKFFSDKYKEALANFTPEFIGFEMQHKFRANNALGNKVITSNKYYFDTDITIILFEENE